MEWCIKNCEFYNAELGICDLTVIDGCPLSPSPDECIMDYEDPLDKKATDITQYDVYSIGELF